MPELASESSLRLYLSKARVSAQDRLELCGDVIRGLYEIHLCGICHGDVKLDNISVDIHATRQDGRHEGPVGPIAKSSDFVHSIMLTSEEASVKQYRGTFGYTPPETCFSDSRYSALDIRKCDLWALGLACWEILANGVPYYETTIVQEALSSTTPATTSLELSGTTLRSDGYRDDEYRLSDLEKVYQVSSQLSLLVQRYIETSIDEIRLGTDQQRMSTSFFNDLLNPDPFKRSAQAFHLSLFYNKWCVDLTIFTARRLTSCTFT